MDFSWTVEQRTLREAATAFAQRELQTSFKEAWTKCAAFGVQGLMVPTSHGGKAYDALTTVGLLEALGYGCSDNGLLFALNAHLWGAVVPLLLFGTDAQQQRYLPPSCQGTLVGSLAVTEPEGGSDITSLRCTAVRRADGYELNGVKAMVTNGPIADLIVVIAKLQDSEHTSPETVFLVEGDVPGVVRESAAETMGLKSAPIGQLRFKGCRIPLEARLGDEGTGRSIFAQVMEWERAFILATSLGAMQRTLEEVVHHARTRMSAGQPIAKHQLVASKLVDIKLRLETSRWLIYYAAWMKAAGHRIPLEASMAKLHTSEAWIQSCLDALQVYGGVGYLTERGIEQQLRDAIPSTLYSGTSEVQRGIIANWLGL